MSVAGCQPKVAHYIPRGGEIVARDILVDRVDAEAGQDEDHIRMVAKKRTSPRRSRLSCCSPRWYMIRRTARGRWNYARDTKVSESSEYSE